MYEICRYSVERGGAGHGHFVRKSCGMRTESFETMINIVADLCERFPDAYIAEETGTLCRDIAIHEKIGEIEGQSVYKTWTMHIMWQILKREQNQLSMPVRCDFRY